MTGSLENLGTATATSVSGHLSTLDPIQITNSLVTYPDIPAGSSVNSSQNYSINAPLANRPATHWDFVVSEQPDCTGCNTWFYNFTYHVGNSFADVPPSYLFYSFIETLLHSGVTAGCTATDYCPEMNVTRAQMAKFIINAFDFIL